MTMELTLVEIGAGTCAKMERTRLRLLSLAVPGEKFAVLETERLRLLSLGMAEVTADSVLSCWISNNYNADALREAARSIYRLSVIPGQTALAQGATWNLTTGVMHCPAVEALRSIYINTFILVPQ